MTPKERAEMQQALEALVVAEEFVDRHSEDWYISGQQDLKQIREAITALREALEQEPLMITPGGGAFPFAVVGELGQPVSQEPVGEALRLSEEAIEYARQGGKVGSGIYGKALSAIRAAREISEETKTTEYMLGFSDGKQYAHKHEQPVSQEPVAKVVMNRANQITMQKPNGDYFDISKHVGENFYTAPQPVKEVELTDYEIAQAVGSPLDEVYLADFRAVIAAHKEKNK